MANLILIIADLSPKVGGRLINIRFTGAGARAPRVLIYHKPEGEIVSRDDRIMQLTDLTIDEDARTLTELQGVFGADRVNAGNVALANAPGNGVADDKAIYPFVPEMVKFYLGEDALLDQVKTYVCLRDDDRKFVLEHLDEMVVKPVDGSGGKGLVVGPRADGETLTRLRAALVADPRGWIAQPVVQLSTVPTFTNSGVAPRHVDLRPFVLSGDKVRVTPGGLTRVALKKGSLVVNSSQGGGTKDTWVLEN